MFERQLLISHDFKIYLFNAGAMILGGSIWLLLPLAGKLDVGFGLTLLALGFGVLTGIGTRRYEQAFWLVIGFGFSPFLLFGSIALIAISLRP